MFDLLGDTRSLISGSTVLPVLVDADFMPNDLDVYVPEAAEIQMLDGLTNGFLFTTDRTQAPNYPIQDSVLRIHWLKKGAHTINVMVVPGFNAAIAIFHFHSTIVMNFISSFGVYCAYPDLTLQKRAIPNVNLILDQWTRNRVMQCCQKYVERGFAFTMDLSQHEPWAEHHCGTDKSCPATLRGLHDDGGLFVPFPSRLSIVGPISPDYIYDCVHSVIWTLGGPVCTNQRAFIPTFVASSRMLCLAAPLVSGL
jgi:hypothetical protein